jgi:hypothetical protein
VPRQCGRWGRIAACGSPTQAKIWLEWGTRQLFQASLFFGEHPHAVYESGAGMNLLQALVTAHGWITDELRMRLLARLEYMAFPVFLSSWMLGILPAIASIGLPFQIDRTESRSLRIPVSGRSRSTLQLTPQP